MDRKRWNRLMKIFRLKPNEETYLGLVKAYSEKHRHYHTVEHVEATLKHLDCIIDIAEKAEEIELALWFHDAVYKPFSATNEIDSAEWAAGFLFRNNVPQVIIDRIHRLIMATLHTAEFDSQDEFLIADIDLTILGAPEDVYYIYEMAVRKEYRRVPKFLYKKKRKEILQSFLDRDRIYHHQYFYERLEGQARINLGNAILAL